MKIWEKGLLKDDPNEIFNRFLKLFLYKVYTADSENIIPERNNLSNYKSTTGIKKLCEKLIVTSNNKKVKITIKAV